MDVDNSKNSTTISDWESLNKKLLCKGSGGCIYLVRESIPLSSGERIHGKSHVVKQITSVHKEREIRNCSFLQSRSFKRLVNVVFVDPVNFLVVFRENMSMDLIDYAERIEKRIKVTVKNCLDVWGSVLLSVFKGVREMHHLSLFHLDIKPDNILIRLKTKKIRFCDFGHMVPLPSSSLVQGTRDYMAPEILENSLYSSSKADIYSLGVTIYVLLFGRFVYRIDKKCPLREIWYIKQNPVVFPKGVSKKLSLLLLRMMDLNPASRPTIDEVIGFWKNLCSKK